MLRTNQISSPKNANQGFDDLNSRKIGIPGKSGIHGENDFKTTGLSIRYFQWSGSYLKDQGNILNKKLKSRLFMRF